MAEFIATALQTVEPNQSILFTDTAICGNNSIMHRNGSGLITLRGITNTQCRARFRITFGANIAVPTGGTAEAISMAITLNGEPVESTVMTVTPAAVEEFFNINRSLYLDVPAGCCVQVGVRNVNTQAIEAQNASLIVERVA